MARTAIPTPEEVNALTEADAMKEYMKALNRRDSLAATVKTNEDAIVALKKAVKSAL